MAKFHWFLGLLFFIKLSLMNKSQLKDYNRQELYELIWSKPVMQLAADFGISDVAVAKHCKKLHVPWPPRGYWAKIQAGQKIRKPPLPLSPEEIFLKHLRRKIPKRLTLPNSAEDLISPASEMMLAIQKARLDSYKMASVREPSFPSITVSKNLALSTAKAFQVLLQTLAPLGIQFHKYRGTYDEGYFMKRGERLSLTISESMIQPDGSLKASSYYWTSTIQKPSGFLSFSLSAYGYPRNTEREWFESSKCPLEKTLACVAEAIRMHYLNIHERREREKEEAARQHAQWLVKNEEWERVRAIQLQREKERNHAEALAAAVLSRQTALFQAAQNWRHSNLLKDFVDACEGRWKAQASELSQEQKAWLQWAKELIATVSPFTAGYPDPKLDGALDSASIPFGGPYPPTRRFSHFGAKSTGEAVASNSSREGQTAMPPFE